MKGMVIRLAGVEQPETRIFHQDVITVGTAVDCDIYIDVANFSLPPDAVIISLHIQDGGYRISAFEPMAGVIRDGEVVAIGDPILDGDTIYFGTTGIRLRFFALSDDQDIGSITQSLKIGNAVLATATRKDLVKDTGRAVTTAQRRGMVPRTDVAIVFVKQLAKELFNEIPRRKLYIIAGIIGFFAFLFFYVNIDNFIKGHQNSDSILGVQSGLKGVQDQLDKINNELRKAREESATIRGSLSLPEKVVSTYGRGVCLIYGSYVFVDPRVGQEVKFKEPGITENPIGPDGTVNLDSSGQGRVYEVEYTATGFLVEPGMILTNRHVAQAWEEDDLAGLIKMRGFRPRLRELYAYFPQQKKAYPLRIVDMMPDQVDIALLSFDQGTTPLPILPLDETPDSIVSGQPVVLLGYPSGLEGLMARVDDTKRLGSRRFGNLSYRSLLNDLSESLKIRPQSTQGHISDVSPQLVYDARTDEGGSGGPVFGVNGKVIGVNRAILLNSQATTNFGVPIRYGIELIKKYKNKK